MNEMKNKTVPAAVAALDAHAAFEASVQKEHYWEGIRENLFDRFPNGKYAVVGIERHWQTWQASRAALAATPAAVKRQFTDGTRTLRQDCISAIRDFAGSKPEDGEDWESWFEAAFDLLGSRVNAVFDEHSTTAEKSNSVEFDGIKTAAPVVLPEPDDSEFEQQLPIQPIGVMGGGEARKVLWNCTFMPEAGTSFYTEQQVRALLATGGQAQAHAVEQEPFGYFKAEPFGWTDCGPDDEGAVALYERPQAQADARDAEQERWMGIGKAIERACVDLPAGAEINIHLEKDAGTVTLSDCDGDEQENFPTDEGLAGVVNAAIDTAIAAAKGE